MEKEQNIKVKPILIIQFEFERYPEARIAEKILIDKVEKLYVKIKVNPPDPDNVSLKLKNNDEKEIFVQVLSFH